MAPGGDGGGHTGGAGTDDEQIDRTHAVSTLRPC